MGNAVIGTGPARGKDWAAPVTFVGEGTDIMGTVLGALQGPILEGRSRHYPQNKRCRDGTQKRPRLGMMVRKAQPRPLFPRFEISNTNEQLENVQCLRRLFCLM